MWTMPLGAVETTTSRSSCSAKAGALSICRMWSGMSALTRWWPAVATVSPSTSGRPAKVRFKRVGRALQPDVGLGRREHDAGRRLRLRPCGPRQIARADAGIGALQAVEADDVDPFVLAIGADGARGGRALADDLDDVAFVEAELVHQLCRAGGRSRGRCRPAAGWRPAPCATSRGRSCRFRPFLLLAPRSMPSAQRRTRRGFNLALNI